MARFGKDSQDDYFKKEELMMKITQALYKLTAAELEALYYDINTKNFISDRND